MFRYSPSREARRYLLRARVGAVTSEEIRVRSRDVTLAAAGDVNLGDGPGNVMAQRGRRWPWGGVASVLRRADIAAINLECAVSNRGSPVPKEYNFRGRPGSLRAVRRFAGVDVVSLANNHAGDYGTLALLDTMRHSRRAGLIPVGAGHTRAAAISERIITSFGLRVAFLGFSDIGPGSFFAGPGKPGTAAASEAAVRFAVRRAARRADVVVPIFHWGVERQTLENARQRALAGAALSAGAQVVIGAHPHVLQPIRRVGKRRVVAYSLGNFVWQSGSALTARTGVLKLRLSSRGVEGVRLLPAVIEGTRPRLLVAASRPRHRPRA
jgi:poly-gamma-glutamate capsule biosynthesis protein CapA/YwtB (metallophosphatase superfamily)